MVPFMRAYTAWFALAFETQMVVMTRTAGLVGLGPLPRGEAYRMTAEKLPAFIDSGQKLGMAMMRGAPPAALFGIWSAPLTRKARANRRRLARHRTRTSRS
ncbi:antifreeze protein [Roseivivax isoporae]|uniref:Antifreeze protein, type I n=1 Tax=Roseivivax isoporae LMG 25204 TaxID=1449351 RepID=X7FDM6_9RHOB|nr:antifreeze protein [Roseivivax isoporae]ETX30176.1 Antifreeze protein, type I [Roseivivax isoporae LMG 25204]